MESCVLTIYICSKMSTIFARTISVSVYYATFSVSDTYMWMGLWKWTSNFALDTFFKENVPSELKLNQIQYNFKTVTWTGSYICYLRLDNHHNALHIYTWEIQLMREILNSFSCQSVIYLPDKLPDMLYVPLVDVSLKSNGKFFSSMIWMKNLKQCTCLIKSIVLE
jgi:hypothetical protein